MASASSAISVGGAAVVMPTTVGSTDDETDRAAGTVDGRGESTAMQRREDLPPDNHVHTHWSWDTADSSTMRRACERAIALGLPSIAFTEHLDFTVWDPDDRATDEGLVDRHSSRHAEIDVEGYFAELADVRGQFPELRILSGVEVGEPHLFSASVAAYLRDAPVDRVLGSLHSLSKDGRLFGVGHLLWGDADETMRRYLGEIVDMI